MDFIVLLIIWLSIIWWTYFSKLKYKYWLIFIFLIYLGFLLYTWYDLKNLNGYSRHFFIDYPEFQILNVLFLIFFFFCYFLIYYIIFILQNKNLNLKSKIQYLLRDFSILYLVFFFFFLYSEVAWKYKFYHNWYLDSKAFNSELYKCEWTKVNLLLEYRYKDKPIVKLYDNFYDFYVSYWKMNRFSAIPTNSLNPELINKDFLQTCINKKWENYYDKYTFLYWIGIKLKSDWEYDFWVKKYFLSDEEVKNILKNLKKD